MLHRKINSILSSAENACHKILIKDLTGKKVEIVDNINCEYTAIVVSVDLVKITGPRHIIVYLNLDNGKFIFPARHQLNYITVLSDNNQELSLNVS